MSTYKIKSGEYAGAIPMAETRYYAVDDVGNVLLHGNPNEGLDYGVGGWNSILYGGKPVQCNIRYYVDKELVKARKNWREYWRNKAKRGEINKHALNDKNNPYKRFHAVRCNLLLIPLPPRQKRTIKKAKPSGLTDLNEMGRV